MKEGLVQEEVGADDKHRRKCLHSHNQAKREERMCSIWFPRKIHHREQQWWLGHRHIHTSGVWNSDIFAVAKYIDAAVVDLIEQILNQANPVPTIIAETIRSLNYCRRKGEGNFIGCAQLLYIWIRSHFWGKCEASLRFCMSIMISIKKFFQKKTVGSSSPGFGLDSSNMQSPVDEPKRCALRMWKQNMGSFVGIVGSCQLCSTARV